MTVGDRVEIVNGKAGTVFSTFAGTVTEIEPERVRVLLDGWRLPIWFEWDQVKGG